MSLTAIRNGVYATLTACGPWSACNVSACCYDVLEATSGCAIVYLPGDSQIEPLALGRNPARSYLRRWQIVGTLYVKDTGDPKRTLGNVWQAVDDLYNTFAKDDTLQGSAQSSYVTRITHAPGLFVEAGGALWAPVRWTVEAQEF